MWPKLIAGVFLMLGMMVIPADAARRDRAAVSSEVVCSRVMPCIGIPDQTTAPRAGRRGRAVIDANGSPWIGGSIEHRVRNSALVRGINAKLRRWVRPSGKCGLGRETLTTYYNSGRKTANGERFYPGGHTAASLKHAFGTMLTVTNPQTGQSVVVRINDRGPFTDADLDLAQGAARAIGMRTSIYTCVS